MNAAAGARGRVSRSRGASGDDSGKRRSFSICYSAPTWRSRTAPVLVFAPAGGWHRGGRPRHRRGEVPRSRSRCSRWWASSRRFRRLACWLSSPCLVGTIGVLPALIALPYALRRSCATPTGHRQARAAGAGGQGARYARGDPGRTSCPRAARSAGIKTGGDQRRHGDHRRLIGAGGYGERTRRVLPPT
jgi:hypothetical protein